jgi:hypothetical protein
LSLLDLLLYGGYQALQLVGAPRGILGHGELLVVSLQLSFELQLLCVDINNGCAGIERRGIERRNRGDTSNRS